MSKEWQFLIEFFLVILSFTAISNLQFWFIWCICLFVLYLSYKYLPLPPLLTFGKNREKTFLAPLRDGLQWNRFLITFKALSHTSVLKCVWEGRRHSRGGILWWSYHLLYSPYCVICVQQWFSNCVATPWCVVWNLVRRRSAILFETTLK